jgi:RND family efflux transporter MFP subunit
VATVPIRRGGIEEKIVVYGTVVSQLGEVRAVSVAFESRIGRMLVTPGQQVSVRTPLIELEPSPATLLALQEARNAVDSAERDLKQVQQRYEQKLATNQELNAAQTASQSAQAKLNNLLKTGAATPQQLKSDTAGVVSKVDVQMGQIVAAGAPLVEIVAEDRIEVRLGIEPEDVPHLKVGQAVSLSPVNYGAAGAVVGHVRLITQRVNPDTRLVDVFASLPPGAKLMLDGFVQGELTLRATEGLIVPRVAALPDDGGYAVFTVREGHAVKHVVQVGLENDREVQIEGDDLHPGEPVVVVGNYELQDGMTVEVEDRPAQTPATRPATGPATAATKGAVP